MASALRIGRWLTCGSSGNATAASPAGHPRWNPLCLWHQLVSWSHGHTREAGAGLLPPTPTLPTAARARRPVQRKHRLVAPQPCHATPSLLDTRCVGQRLSFQPTKGPSVRFGRALTPWALTPWALTPWVLWARPRPRPCMEAQGQARGCRPWCARPPETPRNPKSSPPHRLRWASASPAPWFESGEGRWVSSALGSIQHPLVFLSGWERSGAQGARRGVTGAPDGPGTGRL